MAFPVLAEVRAAAERGDWSTIERLHRETDGNAIRYAMIRTCAEERTAGASLRDAARDSRLARLYLAIYEIEEGWKIRSSYRAQYVSRDQFAAFHMCLRRAEQALIELTAEDPSDVLAWNARLTTARGLELGQAEARRRYDRLAKHDPHFVSAQGNMVQQLCPKWSGSAEALLEFARGCVATAPEGSLGGMVIAEAHLELAFGEGKPEAYLRKPEVYQEVAAAAARTVLHPAYRPEFGWILAHSYFALFHSAAGNWPAAAVHFRALNGYADVDVWRYHYGDAEAVFQRHRARALAKG